MPVPMHGAQRASSHGSSRSIVLGVAFALVAAVSLANPFPTAASRIKVVIVVGPVVGNHNYIANAKSYASQARSYGANVVKIYSPNATWTKVKAAAQGPRSSSRSWQRIPEPLSVVRLSKDGLGLNATAGKGNSNTKYYGEYYVTTQIKLTKNTTRL